MEDVASTTMIVQRFKYYMKRLTWMQQKFREFLDERRNQFQILKNIYISVWGALLEYLRKTKKPGNKSDNELNNQLLKYMEKRAKMTMPIEMAKMQMTLSIYVEGARRILREQQNLMKERRE